MEVFVQRGSVSFRYYMTVHSTIVSLPSIQACFYLLYSHNIIVWAKKYEVRGFLYKKDSRRRADEKMMRQ